MVDSGGLSVDFDCACFVTAVRYFDAARVRAIGRFGVPATLCAISDVAAPLGAGSDTLPTLVAWRSPTESYFITPLREQAEEIETQWSDSDLGCCVAQTDGACIMRVRGACIAEFMSRLGAPTCVPELGESRISRIGELSVMAICVRADEVLLAVERVYAEHLRAWIEATLADF